MTQYSPLLPLIFFLVILFFFSLLSPSISSASPIPSPSSPSSLSLESQLTLPPLSSPTLIPSTSTAYVALHTHRFSSSDWISLHGIRTMYATLRRSNPNNQRKLIVLVSPNTPMDYIYRFQQDDLHVIHIPMEDYHEYNTALCPSHFSKIFLWTLTQYERVVFIDNDVIVLRPLDILFTCGHFCMVYSSIVHFTDSIFVVKPDREIFKTLLKRYLSLDIEGDKRFPILPLNDDDCQKENFYFFIHGIFGNIEAVPFFNHLISPSSPLQYHHPAMRMQASISLNAMMFYENFSWRLMRSAEFRNFTDDMGVPAYTLSFTTLKPYGWVQGLFFNLSWEWHKIHMELLNVNYDQWIVMMVVAIGILYVGVEKGMSRFYQWIYGSEYGSEGILVNATTQQLLNMNNNTSSTAVPPHTNRFLLSFKRALTTFFGLTLPSLWLHYGINNIAILFSLTLTISTFFLFQFAIPHLTPPHIAWPIFIVVHVVGCYGIMRAIWLGYIYAYGVVGYNHGGNQNNNNFSYVYGNANNNGSGNGNIVEMVSMNHVNIIKEMDNEKGAESSSLLGDHNTVRGGDGSSSSSSLDHSLQQISSALSSSPSSNLTDDETSYPSASSTTLITRSANVTQTEDHSVSSSASPTSSSPSSSSPSHSSSPSSLSHSLSHSLHTRSLHFTLLDMIYVFLWECLLFLVMRLNIYPEFVVKMVVIFPLVLVVVVAMIQVGRKVFFSMAMMGNTNREEKE